MVERPHLYCQPLRRLSLLATGLLVTGLLGMMVSLAAAQSMQTANFNGLYLGGHVGQGLGVAGHATSTSLLGGAQAGYNLQWNSALMGVEAEVTAAGLHAKGYLVGTYQQNFMTALKARLGYVTGNFLLALQVGPAFTTLSYHDTAGFSDKSVRGYTGGVNVSYGLTDKIILRADAVRYDFGRPVFSTPLNPHLPLSSNTTVLRAGFDYRL